MHTLILGKPRTGKTLAWVRACMRLYGERALVGLDPQKSFSWELYQQLENPAVLYDRIIRVDRTLGVLQLPRSSHSSVLERMKEDLAARMRIARIFMGRRNLSPETSPLIWEWLCVSLQMIQFSGAPLWWLPFCVQPRTREFRWLVDHCEHEETISRALEIANFSRTQLRNECSPALRLVEPVCTDPCFIARCGTSFDLWKALKDRRVILYEGSGANPETVRTILLIVSFLVIDFCERNDDPVTLTIDEAANWGLITKELVTALSTLSKNNLDVTVISQDIHNLA
jgi:hypothetical protein